VSVLFRRVGSFICDLLVLLSSESRIICYLRAVLFGGASDDDTLALKHVIKRDCIRV
jgi:hypothetical protein